ncbi:MAG: glucosamine-6-phosphate deaminase [Lachnospiraceae bacterium]|nr:glucosamine-6-phosphate deaminase [Lachnospiraceae bacterium]
MRLLVCDNYDEMSRRAAETLADRVTQKPDCVLGLATGSTPLGAYERLVTMVREGRLDLSRVTTVNLDEYRGLGEESDRSYVSFMRTHLFDGAGIPKEHTHFPDGTDPDSDHACRVYEEVLASVGRQDLQLLGLGRNGHIGFNEPGDAFIPGVHLVDLASSTIEANKRFFASEAEVPRQAYTMGMRAILAAKEILLIASGVDKADAVKAAFRGPVTPQVPASVLQLHPDVTVVVDQEAYSKCM